MIMILKKSFFFFSKIDFTIICVKPFNFCLNFIFDSAISCKHPTKNGHVKWNSARAYACM